MTDSPATVYVTVGSMTEIAFFDRDGRPVPTGRAVVPTGRRGNAGYYESVGPCSRCGGAGGADAWKVTGWTCYRCGNTDPMHHEVYRVKVYTPERNAQLDQARDKRDAKRAVKMEEARKAAAIVRLQRKVDSLNARPELEKELAHLIRVGDKFAESLKVSFDEYGSLTEAQLAGLDKALAEDRRRVTAQWVGEVGDRIEISVVVTRHWENYRPGGYHHDPYFAIVTMRDGDGNEFVYKGGRPPVFGLGDRVTMKATVKGFSEFNGMKQTRIARPKRIGEVERAPDREAAA